MDSQYEVLSPWAEVDPIPLRGIMPRLTDIAGKKIGLYNNPKRAAKPMLDVVEEKLRARFPTVEFSSFRIGVNLCIIDTEDRDKFEEWLKGLDAVILAHGD